MRESEIQEFTGDTIQPFSLTIETGTPESTGFTVHGAGLPAGGLPLAVEVSQGKRTFKESRGFCTWSPKNRTDWTSVRWTEHNAEGERITLTGHVAGADRAQPIEVVLESREGGPIAVAVRAPDSDGITLTIAPRKKLACYGAGAQFTHVNLVGHRFPIIAQEPGIGRGIQPLTWFMNRVAGAGGSDVQSSCPSNQFTTSGGWAWVGHNLEPAFLDFSGEGTIRIEVEASALSGALVVGETPKAITERVTALVGRMPPLPSWTQQGAIIGLQGGSAVAEKRVAQLERAGVPVAALWLQDWIGQRKTSVGKQLWWNWERDQEHYPRWDQFKEKGLRTLSYFNPFLIDPTEKGNFRRNLLEEARERGFLVRKPDGSPYPVQNTSFFAELLDLSNPAAVEWYESLIAEHLNKDSVSGWMADFAEALPFDAKLEGSDNPVAYHNAYPVEWARANRSAISKAGAEDEAFFFSRSGHTLSPGAGRCFWLGDQLTSWHKQDGIHSALSGLLSSGFSGFSINHSDVGGYTTTAVPGMPPILPGLVYRRSAELLMRWTELNAFTCLFRTHEGNQPTRNVQIWDSEELLRHFAFFARVFAALAPYREPLFEEAATIGYPLVRHSYLVHPEDEALKQEDLQFFLGDDLLIAPVLEKSSTQKRVRFPAGSWTSLWDPDGVFHNADGVTRICNAPIGTPCVWYRSDSPYAAVFQGVSRLEGRPV